MIRNNVKIKNLRAEYHQIKIPDQLHLAIDAGLHKGHVEKQQRATRKRFLNVCASVLVALSVFTTALNVSPAFADALVKVPFIGRIVEVLIFADGKATGGEVTDGTDISDIHVVNEGLEEEIVINFSQWDTLQSVASAFEIKRFDSPTTMQFNVGGARMISAKEDFERIKALASVKDIYALMTLDDSLIRFNIVFNYPVNVEVKEHSDPAGISILVTKAEEALLGEIYSVRTQSYPLSENFGHLEEQLMWVEDPMVSKKYRILKDVSGAFLFEFGTFKSKEEAESVMKLIEDEVNLPLVIEKRDSNEMPGFKTEN